MRLSESAGRRIAGGLSLFNVRTTMYKLLTVDGNPKTVKGNAHGWMTAILHLAPWKAAGLNVCPAAELAGCIASCLNTAGRGGMSKASATHAPYGVEVPENAIQAARIRRTRLYAEDRDGFMMALAVDIHRAKRAAEKRGAKLAVRLNGTSDIAWENVPVPGFPNIFAMFPDVQFYDYTKLPSRNVASIPNYSLTASYSEASPKYAEMIRSKAGHLNWAVVFHGGLPETFHGRPVIDGDETDLRFLDPAGVVVGLKAKGRAKRDTSGFVVRVNS